MLADSGATNVRYPVLPCDDVSGRERRAVGRWESAAPDTGAVGTISAFRENSPDGSAWLALSGVVAASRGHGSIDDGGRGLVPGRLVVGAGSVVHVYSGLS